MLSVFTQAGSAVILIATDLGELATCAERVAVWTRGAIRAVWRTLELGPDDLNGIADRLEEVACWEPIEAVAHPYRCSRRLRAGGTRPGVGTI